jgi:hypothetical protein
MSDDEHEIGKVVIGVGFFVGVGILLVLRLLFQ